MLSGVVLAVLVNREGFCHREPCGWPRNLGRGPGVSMVKQWAPKGGLTLSIVLRMTLISFLHQPQGPRDPGWTLASGPIAAQNLT